MAKYVSFQWSAFTKNPAAWNVIAVFDEAFRRDEYFSTSAIFRPTSNMPSYLENMKQRYSHHKIIGMTAELRAYEGSDGKAIAAKLDRMTVSLWRSERSVAKLVSDQVQQIIHGCDLSPDLASALIAESAPERYQTHKLLEVAKKISSTCDAPFVAMFGGRARFAYHLANARAAEAVLDCDVDRRGWSPWSWESCYGFAGAIGLVWIYRNARAKNRLCDALMDIRRSEDFRFVRNFWLANLTVDGVQKIKAQATDICRWSHLDLENYSDVCRLWSALRRAIVQSSA